MPGIDEKLISTSGTTAGTELYQPKRSGPLYISMTSTGSPTCTVKVGDSPTATDGPTLRTVDDSAAVTISNNTGITLITPPKYLILSFAAAGAYTANMRLNF